MREERKGPARELGRSQMPCESFRSVGEEDSGEVLTFGGMAGLGSLAVGYRTDVFALGIGSSEKTTLLWPQK